MAEKTGVQKIWYRPSKHRDSLLVCSPWECYPRSPRGGGRPGWARQAPCVRCRGNYCCNRKKCLNVSSGEQPIAAASWGIINSGYSLQLSSGYWTPPPTTLHYTTAKITDHPAVLLVCLSVSIWAVWINAGNEELQIKCFPALYPDNTFLDAKHLNL